MRHKPKNIAEEFREVFAHHLYTAGIRYLTIDQIVSIGKPIRTVLEIIGNIGQLSICIITFYETKFVIKTYNTQYTQSFSYDDPRGTEHFENILQRMERVNGPSIEHLKKTIHSTLVPA